MINLSCSKRKEKKKKSAPHTYYIYIYILRNMTDDSIFFGPSERVVSQGMSCMILILYSGANLQLRTPPYTCKNVVSHDIHAAPSASICLEGIQSHLEISVMNTETERDTERGNWPTSLPRDVWAWGVGNHLLKRQKGRFIHLSVYICKK